MHVLIAGCGYVGSRLAGLLVDDAHHVVGIRRTWRDPPPAGVQAVTADLTRSESLPANIKVDQIVYAASADQFTDDAYRRAYVDGLAVMLDFARAHGVKRFIFVSSTGVYGTGNGGWVDEETEVQSNGSFSALRLQAGEALLAASGTPHVSVRFGGIYGPGRQGLLTSVIDGTARLTPAQPVWTNRIHQDDCAGVLRFVLAHPNPAALYVAVDDQPSLKDDILTWIAHELRMPTPPLGDSQAAPQRGNRRVSNTRLTAAGYQFKYPTYREGFKSLMVEHL